MTNVLVVSVKGYCGNALGEHNQKVFYHKLIVFNVITTEIEKEMRCNIQCDTRYNVKDERERESVRENDNSP